MPTQMDPRHRIPFLRGAGNEHAIAHEAGVVDDRVERAECVERGLDDALAGIPVRDVIGVGHRLAARGADLVDDAFRRALGFAALAVRADAKIVDHDLRAFRRQPQSIGPAEAVARPGDDNHPSFANTHYSLSIIVTLACPPPSHIVCRP